MKWPSASEKTNGEWGKLKTRKLGLNEINDIADPSRSANSGNSLRLPAGLRYAYSPYYSESTVSRVRRARASLGCRAAAHVRSGRCLLRLSILNNKEHLPAVQWDDGDALGVLLASRAAEDGAHYRVKGVLRRGEAEMQLAKPFALLAGGLVF